MAGKPEAGQLESGRLQDRVALITGAGSVGTGYGNGKATAVMFAREGARLMLTDINPDALEETVGLVREQGAECDSIVSDVTSPDSCAALVERCIKTFGALDILHNNVGGSAPGGPATLSIEDWHRQIDHNLNHVFYMCKYALPVMEAAGKGNIINMSSVAGKRYIGHPHIGYSATKGGLIQFTRALALEYSRKGVRANIIVPGLMHTPLVEARLVGQRTDGDAKKLIADRNNQVPMGFMGNAWDVANAAVFLASDESRYITGTEIVVDGGLTAAG